MADRLTITQADRSEIQNRIDQSLNYILNGPGAFWPDGGSRPLHEIVSNLTKYRLNLPRVEDVNDPDEVYRSILNDLDGRFREFGEKLRVAGKFPDDLDVLPPFPDDHIEVQPPSTFFPQLSPKDLLNRFNNPISLQSDGAPRATTQSASNVSSTTFNLPGSSATSTSPDAASPVSLFTRLMGGGLVSANDPRFESENPPQAAALLWPPQSPDASQESPPLQSDEAASTDDQPQRFLGRRTYSLSDPSPYP